MFWGAAYGIATWNTTLGMFTTFTGFRWFAQGATFYGTSSHPFCRYTASDCAIHSVSSTVDSIQCCLDHCARKARHLAMAINPPNERQWVHQRSPRIDSGLKTAC